MADEPDFSDDSDLDFDEYEDDDDLDQIKDEASRVKAKIDKKKKADDLLYDANEDDKLAKWVDKNLKAKGGRETDAVLNCPCCFTPLCYDCQRHTSYKNQFRAMFVVNCKVNTRQILRYGNKSKKPKTDNDTPTPILDDDDVYNPVTCEGCDTEVAVMDRDEVFHFFNVVPSDA